MSFPTRIYGVYGDEKVVQTAKKQKHGTLMELPDGSLYRYCETGEAIGAGNLAQTPLAIANHDMDLVVAASVVVGATVITVTLGSTLATTNQYADGWVYMNDGPGEGHRYRVREHASVASGQVITLTLDEENGVREAITVTTSLCGLMRNPYNGALLYNTTPDGAPTGVACTELASGEFGWLQTRGWAAVLCAGTHVIGKENVASLNTTGAADPHVATGDATPGVTITASPIATAGDYEWSYITIE